MENDKVLDKKTGFEELRRIFMTHDISYGDNTKIIQAHDVEVEEDHSVDVMISFIRPSDKQLFVNIIISGSRPGNGEFFDNYFFTWYGNRTFEIATLNGADITEKVYADLLNILKVAGFKSRSEELKNINIGNGSYDSIIIKKKDYHVFMKW